jgi:protein-S-isoprenylcysteine O-methyltransferase Ste14
VTEAALRRLEASPIAFHLGNLAYAALWASSASTRLEGSGALLRRCRAGEPLAIADALLTLNLLLLVVLHLTRRRASAGPRDWGGVVLANVGTWFPFLVFGAYVRGDRFPQPLLPSLVWPLLVVAALAAGLQTLGLVSLGRSWGVIPANRGVQTRGLYRLVRHPIYAGYIVFYLSYTVVAANGLNVAVCLVTILVLYARALREEAVLFRDPGYAAYAARVRARFVPYVV